MGISQDLNIAQALIEAGTKYKKEILTAPVVAFDEVKPYFTIRNGIQGKIVGGILTVNGQFRPYRTEKGASGVGNIKPYEWEVYLGDLVKEFDPNVVLGSLYTEPTATKPDQMAIARRIALEVALKAGEALYDNLFTAVRNAEGDTSADLFNGYHTIFAKAITDAIASEAIGNYMDLTGTPIGAHNAGDVLKSIFQNLNRMLRRGRQLSLYCPPSIVDYYETWFQQEFGHTPWNKGYQQKELHSSRGRLHFVELDNMETGNFMYVTVKENMNIGFDRESDKEQVEIRRVDNPKVVQLFMKTHFGVGFETIMPEYLCGVKFGHYVPEEPEEPGQGGSGDSGSSGTNS
ncbi:MAG: hypothetical protein LBF81_05380 [Prevotellaceae bacterium]|jgi:hypothetical protein|nr:hypothetical protein [Prevotellaceae bacterium]